MLRNDNARFVFLAWRHRVCLTHPQALNEVWLPLRARTSNPFCRISPLSTSTLPLSQLPPAPVHRRSSVLSRALFGLAAVLATAIGGAFLLHASIDPAEDTAIASTRHEALAGLSTWSDRSMSANVAELATTSFDLVIVDPAPSGIAEAAAIAARVDALKIKPDGEKRLVLAPLAIAEAEDHRAYWNSRWSLPPKVTAVVRRPGDTAAQPANTPQAADPSAARLVTSAVASSALPAWLAEEASERPGNWRVRYWMPEWQSMVFGRDGAMLDTIITAGFDGIVLDRADAHAHWSKQHQDAREDMITFVESMSRYARDRVPGFIVILKDAEDLLATSRIRSAVDAVIKHDLILGRDGVAKTGNDRDIATSIALLKRAQRDGLPVLVAEYPANEASRATAGDRLLAYGFIASIAQRQEKRRLVD